MVLAWLNWVKKATTSLIGLGMVAKLLPTSNQEVRATSTRDRPEKEHKVQHKFIRNKQSKEVNAIVKALIEESTKVRKLLGPTGVKATGTTKTGVVGIGEFVAVSGSSSMSVTARQE